MLYSLVMERVLQYSFKFFAVVAGYYVFSLIGLALTIPPGNASPIWPASGIALGALLVLGNQYAPALFVGSLLKSMHLYGVPSDATGIAVLLITSFGSAFQAVFGVWIINRVVSLPSTLENLTDLLKIMFYGGIVACFVNASISNAALLYAGIISFSDLPFQWYTWWIGDVFGVFVFTPVVMLLFSGQKVSLRRKLLIAVPVSIIFVIVGILFNTAKLELQKRAYQQMSNTTSQLETSFVKDLATSLNSMQAVESFFNASEYVSADEYKTFTQDMLIQNEGIRSLNWLPKVTNENREDFEESIRAQGFPAYEIKRRFEMGILKRSEEKPVYFPLAYAEPYASNKVAHGFDVYGIDPIGINTRTESLDEARDSQEPRATGRLLIVQQEDQYGFIVYHPVYRTNVSLSTIGHRRENHRGYVSGVFVFPRMLDSLILRAQALDLHIVLKDIDAQQDHQILYDSRTEDHKEGAKQSYDLSSLIHVIRPVEVAGRQWQLIFIQDATSFSTLFIQEIWIVALAGVLFNSLLSLFLFVITARTENVERMVDQRTADLLQANAELEEFAYRTSHDLRSPLVSSIGVLKLTQEFIENKDFAKVKDSITLVQGSLNKLEMLIQDILLLAKTKNTDEERQIIDFEKMVKTAIVKMTHLDNFQRIEIEQDLQFKDPLFLQRSRIVLIVENLLSNAIKYQDIKKEHSFVKISTFADKGYFVFVVEDNGLGIPEKSRDDLFTMFKRFHPRVSFGSGLGMYMMKKSADIMGGDIAYEHTGDGSRFTLRVPI